MDKVYGIKIGAIGNAEAYYRRYSEIPALYNNFDRIMNTPSFVPQKGDIAVWGTGLSKYGHIAICTGEGNTSYFYTYDQNWNGKAMKKVKHNYKGFAGVLRYKSKELSYQSHIQNIGWQETVLHNHISGTEGQSKRIEAIIINGLPGIEYRVHMKKKGWGKWCKEGKIAGTVGESRRIEAIEIKSPVRLKGNCHIQNRGWQTEKVGTNLVLGTTGQALRLEAFILDYA